MALTSTLHNRANRIAADGTAGSAVKKEPIESGVTRKFVGSLRSLAPMGHNSLAIPEQMNLMWLRVCSLSRSSGPLAFGLHRELDLEGPAFEQSTIQIQQLRTIHQKLVLVSCRVSFKRLHAFCYFLFAIGASEQAFSYGLIEVIACPGSIPLSSESLELREKEWLELEPTVYFA